MEIQLQCLTPNAGHRSRLHFISQTQQKVRTSYKSTIHARIITNLPGWAYTTPKCDAKQDGLGCCTDDETWSTCFIRLGRGLAGADCNVVNAQKCTWDNTLDTNIDPAVFPKVRYVLKNIYDINDFFTTYFEGMILKEGSSPMIPCSDMPQLCKMQHRQPLRLQHP